MKWPGSTLTDSRSRYHGKNEREGGAEPGQALCLMTARERQGEYLADSTRCRQSRRQTRPHPTPPTTHPPFDFVGSFGFAGGKLDNLTRP